MTIEAVGRRSSSLGSCGCDNVVGLTGIFSVLLAKILGPVRRTAHSNFILAYDLFAGTDRVPKIARLSSADRPWAIA